MEVPYMIFEPVMIFIACLCMTVLHPGLVFGNAWNQIDLIMKAHGKSQQKQSLGKNTPSSHSMSYNRREDPSGDYGLRS